MWNEEARIRCRFSFTCPKLWERLQPTTEANVRYCVACERKVHLALTEEALVEHSFQGHCVAVPVVREGQANPKVDDSRPYIVGNAFPPYGGGESLG